MFIELGTNRTRCLMQILWILTLLEWKLPIKNLDSPNMQGLAERLNFSWFDMPQSLRSMTRKIFILEVSLLEKWSFPLRISSVNVTKSVESCGLVTFAGEIFNVKLRFLCSVLKAQFCKSETSIIPFIGCSAYLFVIYL